MTSRFADTRRSMASAAQYFFWRHPEWWSRCICASAWVLMLFHAWRHAGHEGHYSTTFAQDVAYWMLMAAAMMLPWVLYSVWVTAVGSLWARRHRAIAGFLAGYFGPWLALGIAVAGLRQAPWTHIDAAPALGFGAAALWQRTRMHRRALTACHRTYSLAPSGWRADRDCLYFGAIIGSACVWSCWPLMIACALAGHSLLALAGGMFVAGAERWWFQPRAARAGALAMAGFYFLLAAWKQVSVIASQ